MRRARPIPTASALSTLALALIAASATGCASKQKRQDLKPEAQLLGVELRGDTETESYDLNGDGRPDLFRVYLLKGPKDEPEKRTRVFARQDLDLNFDDAIDVRRTFNEEGVLVREEMDLDFDGTFDAADSYTNGVLYRRDMALNFQGKASVVKYYNNNKLVRKERDTRGDGLMDTFEYYEDGRLVRVGVDRDGDEVPDVYTENNTPPPAPATPQPDADKTDADKTDAGEKEGSDAKDDGGGETP